MISGPIDFSTTGYPIRFAAATAADSLVATSAAAVGMRTAASSVWLSAGVSHPPPRAST
jgi:hypothetical protein